ncbi:MAG: hypothetical protein ABI610_04725 [Acidobacteriota bacterium]
MSAEVAAALECTAEPPHRFEIAERTRVGNGILVTVRRLDEPYPPREIHVTAREMKMGYENVFKACFVCVDRGAKENAIALPKDQIELGLPP